MGSSRFSTDAGKFSPGLNQAQRGPTIGSTAPGEAGLSEVIGAQRLPGRPVLSFRSLTRPPEASPARRSRPVPSGWGWRGWSLPDGLFGGLARLCRVVRQDTRLPILPSACAGPGPLALGSGLH